MQRAAVTFQNGIPELLVLRLLSQKEMYGYQLVREIEETTQGVLSYGEGCIYPTLHSLENSKLVTSRRADAEGRVRTYYRLTARGRRRLSALRDQWDQVAKGVRLVFGEQYA
jgi:PadR family transcriptional regulator, regulatory protein PadR